MVQSGRHDKAWRMKVPGFITWCGKLGLSSRPQRLQVFDALRPAAGLDQIVALIDQIRSAQRCCLRYPSAYWHRDANDLQRLPRL